MLFSSDYDLTTLLLAFESDFFFLSQILDQQMTNLKIVHIDYLRIHKLQHDTKATVTISCNYNICTEKSLSL